jgi:hypothetical protein
MVGREAVYFDPETVTLLRETLDDAWACLSPELQATMHKTALAERILKSAARGERDRKRLRAAALDLAASAVCSATKAEMKQPPDQNADQFSERPPRGVS